MAIGDMAMGCNVLVPLMRQNTNGQATSSQSKMFNNKFSCFYTVDKCDGQTDRQNYKSIHCARIQCRAPFQTAEIPNFSSNTQEQQM